MNPQSQYTTDRLEALRRAKNRADRGAWMAGALAVLGLVILGLALVDYRAGLSKTLREGGVILPAAILLLAALRLWQLVRRAGNAKTIALELEARRPELGCVVSTAAEYLAGQHQTARDYEPELLEALQAQAAKQLRALETPWYRRRTAWAMGVLCAALGALALFAGLMPDGATAIARVTWPWANATYTRVEVKPGTVEIPAGHDLDILANFRGRPPQNAQLSWRAGPASEWQTVALSRSEKGPYTHRLTHVADATVYKIAGGDAVSPEFTISIYHAPEIKSLTTTVNFPAYTKHPPVEAVTPDLRVVRGSKLAFHVEASGDVARANLCLTNQPPIAMTRDENGQWTAPLTAAKSLDYRIELTDQAGRKGGNETPYHLVVAADEPPQVEITDPGADVRADPTNKVPLQITAADDFGVSGIKLVFQKLGEPETVVVCNATNLNEPEASARAEIDLTPLKLKPYEVVAYHAEAWDNNTMDGPGLGKSPVYFIEFTTKEEELPSESHSQVQKINLLQLEKQIIAATTAAREDKIREQLPAVAGVQRQTQEYAETFKDGSPLLAAAPPEARAEFDAALLAMAGAGKSLDSLQRAPALMSEEDALKHLYQAVALFPELKPGMCNCTGVKIVAEAVEKKKQAEQTKREQELPKVIAQAKKMAAAQADLNGLYRQSAELGKAGETPAAAKNQNPGAAKNEGKSPGQNSPGQNGQNGPGEGNNPAQDATAANHSPEAGNAGVETPKPDSDQQNQPAGAPSAEQIKLAEQAGKLAAALRELAGNDPRLSTRPAQQMKDAAEAMRQAGKWAANREFDSADNQGGFALSQLRDVVRVLEILSHDQPQATDAAAEEYPKAYAQRISDYLRTLSYQK